MIHRKSFRPVFAAFLLSVGAIAARPAAAHGNDEPQHGGIVQVVGEAVIELVARPDGVDMFLVDDHAAAVAAEYTARIKVLSGGSTQDAVFTAGQGNRFRAAGVKLGPGARAIVTVKRNSTGATSTARFTVP